MTGAETRPDDATLAPRVSVIIPHLNTPDSLRRCLQSVIAQKLDAGMAEVFVVDNGSSVPMQSLAAEFPGVTFLSELTPGPGAARNRGIAAANAPILAFIDADCRAAADWLQTAVREVEKDLSRAIVGGDIRIDFANPAFLTSIEAYEAVFGFRQKLYIERKHFSVTANLAMATPVHSAVGPFAGIERAEDLDWGQRARTAGFTTRYVPEMRVYHPARQDFAALARKWQRHVRHDWNAHQASGKAGWQWQLRAAALLASVPIEAGKLMTSNRISGLANRMRGIATLARIRGYRAAEMLRVMSSPAESGESFWNRQS